jgi:hypothetical protein
MDFLINKDKIPFIGSKTHLNPVAIGYITIVFTRSILKLPVKTADLDNSPYF